MAAMRRTGFVVVWNNAAAGLRNVTGQRDDELGNPLVARTTAYDLNNPLRATATNGGPIIDGADSDDTVTSSAMGDDVRGASEETC